MTRSVVRRLMAQFLLCAAFSASSVSAQQQNSDERVPELIAQHRQIMALHGLEAIAREMYFDQSFILLHLHGKRTEHVGSYNYPPRMLRAAVDSRFVPTIKRFKARLGKMDGLNAEQKAQVASAIAALEAAIEVGYAMADEMEAGDLDAATTLFYEQSLPEFKSSWADLYTVISGLERSFPRK